MIIKRVGKRKKSLYQWFYSQLYSIGYDLREYKWKVYNFFRSSQHWLIKKIPRSYQDKSELIPLILFEILIDFVETEQGLKGLTYDYADDREYVTTEYLAKCKARDEELLAAYHFATVEKSLMEAKLVKIADSDFDIKEYIEYENLLHQKEEKAMMTIVKYSSYLWT